MPQQTLPPGAPQPRGITEKSKNRIQLLDSLRGILILSMMLYHACWSLVNIYGFAWSWFNSAYAYLWQQSICCGFILLSGFCCIFSHSPVRRGMILFGWGAVITRATMAFFPAGEIWFGILTLLGVCMLLIPAVKRLPIAPAAGLDISLLLFILLRGINDGTAVFGLIPLPGAWYRNYFTAFLGFPQQIFSLRIISRCCLGFSCS